MNIVPFIIPSNKNLNFKNNRYEENIILGIKDTSKYHKRCYELFELGLKYLNELEKENIKHTLYRDIDTNDFIIKSVYETFDNREFGMKSTMKIKKYILCYDYKEIFFNEISDIINKHNGILKNNI